MPRKVKAVNAEIGARIKQERKTQKLTRNDLAELTGYSADFIQEVECGRSGLSCESIRAFSTALKISTDTLLFGAPSEGFEYIIQRLKDVPPEKLRHIIKIMDEAIECTRQI